MCVLSWLSGHFSNRFGSKSVFLSRGEEGNKKIITFCLDGFRVEIFPDGSVCDDCDL